MKTIVAGTVVGILFATVNQAQAADPQLAHAVYFKVKEGSGDAKGQLVAACKKFLSEHEGTVYFAAGVLAEEMNRDVNDRDFDVFLLVVFKNKAAHDKYQTDPRHLKFIEEYSELWDSVRVFDSYLGAATAPARAERPDRPDGGVERIPLPDLAASFAGMIRGKVVAKREGQAVVTVEKVLRQWKTNRAEDSESLIGNRVLVAGGPSEASKRFVAALKVGETIELDVAHKTGEVLTILELTPDQRQRVAE
ncbi:MAG: Dabb family protein [Pirellulaceae bacterium]|nr:Dabb family protein [Pirellulaceae bacterium]